MNGELREYRKTATIRAVQYLGQAVVGVCTGGPYCKSRGGPDDAVPHIHTLEGDLTVSHGDWIATGVQGEHWAIKPDVFAATYAEADRKLSDPVSPLTADLHPKTAHLVNSFAIALAHKLRRAEEKYGYSDGWLTDDWEGKCRADLRAHVEKGDPLDVAAYAAFCWARNWSTAEIRALPTTPSDQGEAQPVAQTASITCAHEPYQGSCAHCGIRFVNGRPHPAPEQAGEVERLRGAAILKGVGKITGDGWKDATVKGEVVFVWNSERPAPYKAGQYPRIGNEGWSASTEQYDFVPATHQEVRSLFEAAEQALADMKAERALDRDCLQLADTALACVTAFEDDARYIMGNSNFNIVQANRDAIRARLSKGEGE